MAIRYFYIDDDPIATITETARGLSNTPSQLIVQPYQHQIWEQEISFLKRESENFDGLLFDWGLTSKNTDGDRANYNVEALAQQLRRLIIENKEFKKDFPIVLCSAQYKFKSTFHKEFSSHDLFDAVYEKDDFSEDSSRIKSELIDLANGYKLIQEAKSITAIQRAVQKILGYETLVDIDYRIIDFLSCLLKDKMPVHEISRFLISKVINWTGPLINEYVLASRLGIDIINGSDRTEWKKLLNKLKECKYNGVFCNAWNRWWMNSISIWWEKNFVSNIGSLDSKEKVQLLNKKFKLKLVAFPKSGKSKSDNFWVICKESNIPIAIDDAIMTISTIDKAPWAEDDYLSIDKALFVDNNMVHSLERERLKKLKKIHTQARPK